MTKTNARLNEWQIVDAVEEIRKLKDEKNITWEYIYKHCPNAGSKSAKALNRAVNAHSVIIDYQAVLELLRSAKCQDRESKIDKLAREERANAIAKRKKELNITYDEMFRFYKGHKKHNKHAFTDQARRGYGSYSTDLVKWLNELTPESLAELRRLSKEEDQEYKEHFEENSVYINEINKIKKENNLTWTFLFNNTNNGCKNRYFFQKSIETASGMDFKHVYKDLKKIDFEKIKENKKAKKKKTKQYKNRYGRPFEGRRLVRVYAKENGIFGLQREYLE